MISIYEVNPDFNFSIIMPSERSFDKSNRKALLSFNGESKMEAWGPKRYCYVPEPKRPLGDFAGFYARRLAVRADAFAKADRLSRFFNKWNMELLPLVDQDEGTEWFAINMIYVPNIIDRDKSILTIRPYRQKFEFYPDRIRKQNVFSSWWPDSLRGAVLCWEENKDPDSEFKAYVEKAGLSGLEFRLLWDEEKGGRLFEAGWDSKKGLVLRDQDEQ